MSFLNFEEIALVGDFEDQLLDVVGLVRIVGDQRVERGIDALGAIEARQFGQGRRVGGRQEVDQPAHLKPRFNVVLRDDKSFAELMIRSDHRAPQIRKHRGAHTTPGQYFGPFASTWAVNRTLNTLQKAFLLRTCTDSVYANRTRPCLLYQIKRCSGPCVGLISQEAYAQDLAHAEAFLRGETSQVLRPTRFALDCPQLQNTYDACWATLPATFNPHRR